MFNMRLRNIFALPVSKEHPEQVPGGIFPEGYANQFPDIAPETICVGRAPQLPVSVEGLDKR